MDTNLLPRAVIFDMDGVIADTEPLHGGCFLQAFRELGIEITFEQYRQAVTLGGSTVKDYFVSLGGDVAEWDKVKSLKDAALSNAVVRDGALMPGIEGLLKMLRCARIKTAVATSARRRSLDIILDHFDLWPHFDCFATKNEVKAEKPDPAVFLLAAKKLEVSPAECVVIEDSPRGVLAAYRAGMKCIAVPTSTTHDGDFTLATACLPSLESITLDVLRKLFIS